MRDIKFRAWNKEKKIMCYDNEDGDADYWDGVFSSILGVINHNITTPRYDFMQYTGLKDKNGKEIYEGDIVHIPDDWEEYGWASGENYEIDFKDGRFRLKPKYKPNAIGYDLENTNELEIIGNIYDNPDLLEKGKEE